MTTVVIDCAPVKATQFGRLVMVEFSDNAGAIALKQALDDARLARQNPAELHRRYAEEHGIAPGTAAATD